MQKLFYEQENFKLWQGSNLEVLPTLPDNSVDSIVTDPPYELGFMGKTWDNSGIAYSVELWRQCLRVLKPGGHLIAFSGSRTYHRMAVAIEDAGFEIRDQLMWLYGSGFPKSLDMGKAIEGQVLNGNSSKNKFTDLKGERLERGNWGITKNSKEYGFRDKDYTHETDKVDKLGKTEYQTQEGQQWDGWKSALKPAHEPMVLARKPFEKGLNTAQNILKWGVGALNIDESRITSEDASIEKTSIRGKNIVTKIGDNHGKESKYFESGGRYPANVITDGSEEVKSHFPNTKKGGAIHKDYTINNNIYGDMSMMTSNHTDGYGDSGSAARFFYGAKAQTDDRDQGLEYREPQKVNDGRLIDSDNAYQRGASERKNIHPTVKPTDLMRYLVRLVTPKNGVVLDPFMGSGSTGKGAMVENINNDKNYTIIGIELTEEYLPIARDRVIKGAAIFAQNEKYGKPKKQKVEKNQVSLINDLF